MTFGKQQSPYQLNNNRKRHNNILWDRELIKALATESGMSTIGIQHEVKALAEVLDIRLPRWGDLSCFSETKIRKPSRR